MQKEQTNIKGGKGRRIWGVTWRVLCGVLVFICTAVFAFVVVDRIRFRAFYQRAESTFAMPGIHSGYVPQGFDYDTDRGLFLSTGYMSNGKASRVYVMDGEGGEYHAALANADGSAYTGHTGGIVHNGDYVYVTGDNGLDVFAYQDILAGNTAKKVGEIRAYINPAYCYIADGYLLTGSFYREGNFETADYERMETPCGEKNTALITVFKLDEGADFGVNPTPCAVISTRGLAQGMCITDSGKIILSTSYALAASKLFVYDSAKLQVEENYVFSGKTKDGLPFSLDVKRVFLDGNSLVDVIKAPAMSEELVYLDGKIYIMNESACNKYIFGKLTSGLKVYAYPYV